MRSKKLTDRKDRKTLFGRELAREDVFSQNFFEDVSQDCDLPPTGVRCSDRAVWYPDQ